MAHTLVTGASSGIGAAFARIATAAGHDLVLSARSEDALQALAGELRSAHDVDVAVIPADLSKPEGADRLWAKAIEERRIGMLVNNAGLGRNGDSAVGGWEREAASLQVNMVSLTWLTKLAVPHMIAAGDGRILNVGSLAGYMPGPGMAVYHASKAYVLSLGEALATELKGTGVSVTTLCPGATDSGFLDAADMRRIPLVRMTPLPSSEQVARVGFDAAMARRRVAVPGAMNKLAAVAARLMPRTIVLPLIRRLMKRPAPAGEGCGDLSTPLLGTAAVALWVKGF